MTPIMVVFFATFKYTDKISFGQALIGRIRKFRMKPVKFVIDNMAQNM
jgi:hypothetical protein